MEGKKVLLILANGNEEVEAFTPVDILRRAGIEVTVAGLDSLTVTSAHNVTITADTILEECNANDYDGIILPGGMPGTLNLLESSKVITLLQEFYAANKLCAAICAAPRVLDKANILTNHSYTCFPGAEEHVKSGTHQNTEVVVDKNIITGKAVGAVFPFSLSLVEYLLGSKKRKAIAQTIHYYN